ncbi:MAG: hypothetical protein U1F43_10515 [Myxococcota bacterium]
MRLFHPWVPCVVVVTVLGAGCAGEAGSGPGDRVAIHVAPLDLPGIGYACYDVRVSTGAGGSEVVWSEGDPDWTQTGADQGAPAPGTPGDGPADTTTICSSQYGNTDGGDITYIGTCDASVDSDGDDTNGVQNKVTVWVDGLYATGGAALGDWQDPCPGGCSIDVDCSENADSPADFSLAIMRSAHQGFFDVAVNFSDVFCSAKLDTCYADGPDADLLPDPITLLFGGDGTRDWTANYAMACTGGAGDGVATTLLYGPVEVACSGPDVTFALDPRADEGNAEVTVAGHTLHYGVYRGAEGLDCGEDGPCNKVYWNLAIDLADLESFASCSLSLAATAHDGSGFDGGLPTADGLAYPYIQVDADLVSEGAFCQQNPLNGVDPLNEDSPSQVVTAYAGSLDGLDAPLVMCSQFDGATVSETGGCRPAPRIVTHVLTATGLLGLPITATLSYDVGQPPSSDDGGVANYQAYSFTVEFAGNVYHEDPTSSLMVANDQSYGDALLTNGTNTGYAGLNLTWDTSALASSGLPSAISAAGLTDSFVVVPGAGIFGRVTSITTITP